MMMNKPGWFSYFNSRNNNFSNRQNIGIICVGPGCKLMNGTGVLQDVNPATNGKSLIRASVSKCVDTANSGTGSNANGATSCLSTVATNPQAAILTTETFTRSEGDNDALGDGNQRGCTTLRYSAVGTKTVQQRVALAIILLFVGLFSAWFAYYLYNRYQARLAAAGKYRYDVVWQKSDAAELSSSKPAEKAVAMSANPSSRAASTSSNPSSPRVSGATPSSPPTSPTNSARGRRSDLGRSPSASSAPTAATGSTPKSGRVLSTKRARPRHEEMI